MTTREWIRAIGVIVFCVGGMLFPAAYVAPQRSTSFLPSALTISPNLFINFAIYFLVIGSLIWGLSYIDLFNRKSKRNGLNEVDQ